MAYKEPDVKSSYRVHNLGKNIYETVMVRRPDKIIEFGTLEGFSTIVMAQALKEIGSGHIYAYDLWERYEYTHSDEQTLRDNLKKYDVEDFVTIKQVDFWDWIKDPEQFDLMHLDISNTGDILLALHEAVRDQIKNGSAILFEGGSKQRDEEPWMTKYNKEKMYPLKEKINYSVLNDNWPSVSIME